MTTVLMSLLHSIRNGNEQDYTRTAPLIIVQLVGTSTREWTKRHTQRNYTICFTEM